MSRSAESEALEVFQGILTAPVYDVAVTSPLEEARLLIAPHTTAESPWAPLAAAAFFAISAILFASVVIMSPPPRLTPISAVQAPV